jgi:hypothetical protein
MICAQQGQGDLARATPHVPGSPPRRLGATQMTRHGTGARSMSSPLGACPVLIASYCPELSGRLAVFEASRDARRWRRWRSVGLANVCRPCRSVPITHERRMRPRRPALAAGCPAHRWTGRPWWLGPVRKGERSSPDAPVMQGFPGFHTHAQGPLRPRHFFCILLPSAHRRRERSGLAVEGSLASHGTGGAVCGPLPQGVEPHAGDAARRDETVRRGITAVSGPYARARRDRAQPGALDKDVWPLRACEAPAPRSQHPRRTWCPLPRAMSSTPKPMWARGVHLPPAMRPPQTEGDRCHVRCDPTTVSVAQAQDAYGPGCVGQPGGLVS